MDIHKWAGQFLMVGFRNEEFEELLELAAQGRVGGVIFFERNGKSGDEFHSLCRKLLDTARSHGAPPPILAVDQEQGRVCRIKGGLTRFPSPEELGTLDRPTTTRSVARWVARELSSIGINLNLAPVADVLMETSSLGVLQGRSFGGDPEKVAMQVAAWVRGSQEGGVASCPKHFPGHGGASCDTHTGISWDTSDIGTLSGCHMVPFRRAVTTGAACIMMSHVIYPALDKVFPASLSKAVILGLLRGRMGFEGLIITDDLEMKAVSMKMNPLQASILALEAGADMILVGRNLRGDLGLNDLVRGLEDAAKGGHVEERRLEGSLKRIRGFKERWISAPKRHGPFVLMGARRLARRIKEEILL